MNKNFLPVRRVIWPVLGALLLLTTGYLVQIPGYVLYHGLAEIFAIVISCAVFTLTWNTRAFLEHDYFLAVGIALLAASALNVVHTLSYKGMGVFPTQDANLPTQLWIARRYLESIALLIALVFLRRKLNAWLALVAFGVVTALLLGAIFANIFPAAYVEGVGLTPFKKVSEFVIAGLFLASAYGVYRQRSRFGPGVSRALIWSLVIAAGAELLFTLYVGVYDLPNRLGHVLTIVSYYLIYLAIVKTGIVRPYMLLSTANASLSHREAALLRQTQWLQSLHEIDRALLRSQSLAEIAAATAESLVRVTGALRAAIGLFNPDADEMVWLGAYGAEVSLPKRMPLTSYWLLDENRAGRTGTVPDVQALPEGDARRTALLARGIRCYTGVPITSAGESIGAIVLGHAQPGPLAADLQDFVRQVADQMAVAIQQEHLVEELQRSREQLRSLSHHLVNVQEAERKQLSRELHDRSGQSMTALKLHLLRLQRAPENPAIVRAGLTELTRIADIVVSELHDLATGLRPPALDRYGLAPALEQLLASFRIQNDIEAALVVTGLEKERLQGDMETTIYRIVQESLTNIARYAAATHVDVRIARENGDVIAVIRDDGCGFDVAGALAGGRLGLLGMRERAEMLGGRLEIESTLGEGTEVRAWLPVLGPVMVGAH